MHIEQFEPRPHPNLDEDAIYQILTNALLSARLAPGTKLGEHKLVSIFGVTRERIRKVLHKLGHKRLIDLVPNRGAFVFDASLDETRLLYEARRIMEVGIVLTIVDAASDAQIAGIKAHIETEEEVLGIDVATSTRLSGGFHMVLAQITGNDFIIRQMRELLIRTIMLDSYFEAQLQHRRSVEEHYTIYEALERRDAAAATQAMTSHLMLVERRFKPTMLTPAKTDLAAVLQDEIARWRSGAELIRI